MLLTLKCNIYYVLCFLILVLFWSGLPSQAFEYIRYNKGIELEEEYPYVGRDETCRFNSSEVVATVSDVHNFTQVIILIKGGWGQFVPLEILMPALTVAQIIT